MKKIVNLEIPKNILMNIKEAVKQNYDIIIVDPLGVHDIGAAHGQGSYDCPRMVNEILQKSPMDTIIFENEIAYTSLDEPIESARAREMKACEESVRYCRDVLKLGIRNR